MRTARTSNRYMLGLALTVVYLLIVLAVYVLTKSSPPDDGMEWIPFILLAMPWYKFSPELLFPGFVINAGGLFLLGMFAQRFWPRPSGHQDL